MKMGLQCTWRIQHLDANGKLLGKYKTSNHFTRRGAIEIVERVHRTIPIPDSFGGRTETLSGNAFSPRWALIDRAGFTSYHREDRLGWNRTGTPFFRNFTYVVDRNDLNDNIGHALPDPVKGTNWHTDLSIKDQFIELEPIRFTLAEFNASRGIGIWHIHGTIPTGNPPNPSVGQLWAPLTLALWDQIPGGAGDFVDVSYRAEINVTIV